MARVYIEQRELHGASLSWDIAHHMYTRQLRGKVLIVTEQPHILMPAVKKCWKKLEGQVLRERSRTLNVMRLIELGNTIAWMQTLQFATKPLPEAPDAHVFFVEAEQVGEVWAGCHTVYMMGEVTDDEFAQLEALAPRWGLMVIWQHY